MWEGERRRKLGRERERGGEREMGSESERRRIMREGKEGEREWRTM